MPQVTVVGGLGLSVALHRVPAKRDNASNGKNSCDRPVIHVGSFCKTAAMLNEARNTDQV